MPDPTPPARIEADYFDGRRARAHAVTLSLQDGELTITGEQVQVRWPTRQVQWPERTRHGARVAQLPDGASLHSRDAVAWDRWAQAGGQADSWVVRAQQSWRGAAVGGALLVALLVGLWAWGLPWLGQATAAALPQRVDQALGEAALNAIDEQWMSPSTLPATHQQLLRSAFERALAAQPAGQVPAHTLVFRRSRVGPNAFALPGGVLVLTDQLVMKVQNDTDVIVGVLAHELGHVKHRHAVRLLVQAGVISAVSSVVLGDFSTLLAAVPLWLGHASYSRDAEREADAHAVAVLNAAGISPLVMVRLFKLLAADRPATGSDDAGPAGVLGIATASHPPDAERIAFFTRAAAAR